MIICIEGIDGSGESTHARRLAKRLSREGYSCEVISFPDYETILGKKIKAFLDGQRKYEPEIVQLLFAGNRLEHRLKLIKYKKGGILIADRYTPSGLAYGLARGFKLDWLLLVESGVPPPDLVIIIDIPIEVHVKRSRMKDVYERNLNFLKKVRESYLKLAEKFDWKVINGDREIEEVHEDIWKITLSFIGGN